MKSAFVCIVLYKLINLNFFAYQQFFFVNMDPMYKNKNVYLLDGGFTCNIRPYVDIDSVMKHPLWGSQLLLTNEEAIISSHKDYIKG